MTTIHHHQNQEDRRLATIITTDDHQHEDAPPSSSSSSKKNSPTTTNNNAPQQQQQPRREFYRNQTSAVNQELLDHSDETLNILTGTESLVLTEAEKWRQRFFEVLAKTEKSTTDLLNQYGIASEMLDMDSLPSLEDLDVPPLHVDDERMKIIFKANKMERDESYYPFAIRDEEKEKKDVAFLTNRKQAASASGKKSVMFVVEEETVVENENNNKTAADEHQEHKEGETNSAVAAAAAASEDVANGDSHHSSERSLSLKNNKKRVVVPVSNEIQSKLERLPIEFQLDSTRQCEEFLSILRELRINSRATSNASSKTSQARFVELGRKLNEAVSQLLPLTLEKFNPVQPIIDLAKTLQADPLIPMKVELNRLQKEIEEIEGQLQGKVRDRGTSAISEHYVLVEEINDEIAELYREAMKLLVDAHKESELASGDVSEFLENVNKIDGSLGSLDAAVNEQEALEEGANNDLKILERQLETKQLKKEKDANDFQMENGRLLGELDTLHQHHTTIWNEVLAKLNELNGINEKIGTVRSQVASLVTRNAGVEAKHLREVQSITRLISMRKCTATSAKKGAEILLATKSYATEMLDLISKKEYETIRQRLALEQCVRFYDTYSGYVVHLQDCAGKKEQRLENSKRLKRSVNFQVEVAAQTMDPNVTKYREQLLGLNDLLSSMESSVKKIQDELQEGEFRKTWTETIEPQLHMAGIPFEEPSQRVQHLRLEMLQRQFAAVDGFQRDEQQKLDEERRVVRVMKNLVHQQQQQQNNNNTSLNSNNINNTSNNSNGSPPPSPSSADRRAMMNRNSPLFGSNNNWDSANNNNTSGGSNRRRNSSPSSLNYDQQQQQGRRSPDSNNNSSSSGVFARRSHLGGARRV